MLNPAWISRCKMWMRRPAARIGLVIVLGTCLWAMVGRRDRVVENVVAATDLEDELAPVETSRPPVSLGVRKLPQRMLSRPVEIESAPIHADFVSSPAPEPQTAADPARHSAE